MAIYEVTTEKGTYQIETEDSQNPPAEPQKQKGFVDKVKDFATDPANMVPYAATARLGNKLLEKSQEGYDLMGNLAAEKIDRGGKHPYLSSAIGGTIQNIPAITAAAEGVTNTAGLAKGVKGMGESIKGAIKSFKSPSKAKLLTQTADDIQNDLSKLALKKTGLAREFNQKKIEAMTARKEAGKAIEVWESNIEGYKFGGQPEITESTRGLVKTIANLSPKKLAQKYDLKQLQELYDKAKGMGTQGLDAPLVTRAKQNITEAQDMFSPGIKDLREAFGNASKAVEGWANEFKMGKASVADMTKKKQLALADVKNQLKKTQEGRELLKTIAIKGIGSAISGLGLGAGYSLLK